MRCWSPSMRVTWADRPCLSVDPHRWPLSDVTLAFQWGTQQEATRAPCSVAESTQGWGVSLKVTDESVWLSKAPPLVKFSLCAPVAVSSRTLPNTLKETVLVLQMNGSLITGSYEWARGQAPCSPGYSVTRLTPPSLAYELDWLTDGSDPEEQPNKQTQLCIQTALRHGCFQGQKNGCHSA